MPSKPTKQQPKGGHNKTRNAELAIAELLAGATIKDAARKAVVGVRTLESWMKSDWFKTKYDAARQSLLQSVVDMLAEASTVAVRVLRGVASDRLAPHGSRVSASAKILELSAQYREMSDIIKRLEKLERENRDA